MDNCIITSSLLVKSMFKILGRHERNDFKFITALLEIIVNNISKGKKEVSDFYSFKPMDSYRELDDYFISNKLTIHKLLNILIRWHHNVFTLNCFEKKLLKARALFLKLLDVLIKEEGFKLMKEEENEGEYADDDEEDLDDDDEEVLDDDENISKDLVKKEIIH